MFLTWFNSTQNPTKTIFNFYLQIETYILINIHIWLSGTPSICIVIHSRYFKAFYWVSPGIGQTLAKTCMYCLKCSSNYSLHHVTIIKLVLLITRNLAVPVGQYCDTWWLRHYQELPTSFQVKTNYKLIILHFLFALGSMLNINDDNPLHYHSIPIVNLNSAKNNRYSNVSCVLK